MRPHVAPAIGLLLAGCSLTPPPGEPAPVAPAPTPAPPGPRMPQGEDLTQEQKLDFTIIAGPESMAAGQTESLTARVMAPPGSQVVGIQATQGKDAYTYGLKLAMRVPTDAGAPRPLEVQIPFSPPSGGTYYLDSARRYAVQVGGQSSNPTRPASTTGPGRTTSFLDRQGYSGGAYVPGGTPTGSVTPASTDTSAKPMFGAVVPLTTLTVGAISGNAQVSERDLQELQGPRYGRRGERMRFTASLWTAGTGPIRPDIVQDGFEVKVSALMAPAEREPIGAPMPRQASMQFSWTFQDPGLYRLTTQNGLSLGTVQVY